MPSDEPSLPSEPNEAEGHFDPLPNLAVGLKKGHKVWISRSDPESDDSPDREYEDIMLRRVPIAISRRFRGAAGARGLTHAQYLTALVTLHENMRQRADGGDDSSVQVLAELGLGTVSI
jgi:hypothetical protein